MLQELDVIKGLRENVGGDLFVTFDKYFILSKRILKGTYKCQL